MPAMRAVSHWAGTVLRQWKAWTGALLGQGGKSTVVSETAGSYLGGNDGSGRCKQGGHSLASRATCAVGKLPLTGQASEGPRIG